MGRGATEGTFLRKMNHEIHFKFNKLKSNICFVYFEARPQVGGLAVMGTPVGSFPHMPTGMGLRRLNNSKRSVASRFLLDRGGPLYSVCRGGAKVKASV